MAGDRPSSIREERPDVQLAILHDRLKRMAAAIIALETASRNSTASLREGVERRIAELDAAIQKEVDARVALEREVAVLQESVRHREKADDTQSVKLERVETHLRTGTNKIEIKKKKIDARSGERRAWITAGLSLLATVVTAAFALLPNCGH